MKGQDNPVLEKVYNLNSSKVFKIHISLCFCRTVKTVIKVASKKLKCRKMQNKMENKQMYKPI